MRWPVRWLLPMETARDAWEALTAVNQALSTLHGDRLEEWRKSHSWEIEKALEIEALRTDLTDG